jgi:hypothetical protein
MEYVLGKEFNNVKKPKGSIPKAGTFDKEFHFFLEIFVWYFDYSDEQ